MGLGRNGRCVLAVPDVTRIAPIVISTPDSDRRIESRVGAGFPSTSLLVEHPARRVHRFHPRQITRGSPSPTSSVRDAPARHPTTRGRGRVGEWWARTTPLPLPPLTPAHAHPTGHRARTKQNAAAAAAAGSPGAAAPAREDGLGGDVEHGAVVALPRGLLRAVPEPRRRGEQDGRLLLPLLPRRVPAALPGAGLQGLLLLPLLRQRQGRRRRRRQRLRRRARPPRRRWSTRRPRRRAVDEGGGHRGGRAAGDGRRRRRRVRRRRRRVERDPQAGPLRDPLRGGLHRPLLLLRAHPLGRQPQPAARRHARLRHVPPLRRAGRDRRLARPHRDGLAQRHRQAHLPQHRHLLRRPRLLRARHALLHAAPARLRQYQVLLPGAEKPAEPDGVGGGRQGAAVRRRVEPEQHADDAAAGQEEDAVGGGAAAAGPAGADGAASVARLRAGQAGQAQVPQRGALQGHHGPDQARQARLPQEGLHLQPLIGLTARLLRLPSLATVSVVVVVCCCS